MLRCFCSRSDGKGGMRMRVEKKAVGLWWLSRLLNESYALHLDWDWLVLGREFGSVQSLGITHRISRSMKITFGVSFLVVLDANVSICRKMPEDKQFTKTPRVCGISCSVNRHPVPAPLQMQNSLKS
jgi:hypothetical protein